MKILVLGDLHCRSIWKDIVTKEGKSCDKIVFLGDYTCPKEVKLTDPTDACGFLYEIIDFKDQNPDKVILLRGNHDLDSLGYCWAQCWPQDHPKVAQYWQTKDVKNWFLKNTQWVYPIPRTNIVCSHAGISARWKGFQRALDEDCIDSVISDPPITVWDRINSYSPSELFGFTPCKLSDYNGISATQPCTWIRPQALMSYGVKDIIHIVGHTPVSHIANIKEECLKYSSEDEVEICENRNSPDIWCCDCLENGEYLIIEDGKFIVKSIQ